jgi:asparagine synthase (glutamine-hydrolysing)
MCGFAGLLSIENRIEDLNVTVRAMGDRLAARGPDGEGSWVDPSGTIALAHRRLAIFECSDAGAQPMHSATGRYTIAWNGEVYNHPELRATLGKLGHAFENQSDTAVLLAAFEQWGVVESLARFNGMFALAVVDGIERSITLVRDRAGQKPLCFAALPGVVAFASEGRALEALPGRLGEAVNDLDPIALSFYLELGAVPTPRTIRRGVERVAPGGWIRINATTGSIERGTWWTPTHESSVPGDLDALDNAFDKSVAIRLRADRPVGVFLSGGLDSRLIATYAARHTSSLRAFTLKLPGCFDESNDAAATANALSLDHHVVEPSLDDLLSTACQLQTICDEPFADSSLLATTLLARAARSNIVVALGGDGGDELFGGYRRHRAAYAPSHVMLGRLASLIPRSVAGRWPLGRLSFAEAADRLSLANRREYRRLRATQGDALSMMLHQATADPWHGDLPLHPDVREMMRADFQTYLPDDPLTKVDRGSMAVALEVRSPMLDPTIIDHAFRWPTNGLFDASGGRAPLRHLLARHSMSTQSVKQGFAVPLFDWLRGPLNEWATDLMLSPADDVLDQRAVSALWRQLLRGRRDRATSVWTILCLRSWTQSRAQ